MRTILVLTDFSEAAYKAAQYAVAIGPSLSADRIILLHVNPGESAVSNVPIDERSKKDFTEKIGQHLSACKDSLSEDLDEEVNIQLFTAEGELSEVINRFCSEQKINLVIMGMKGKTGLEKIIIGSNAIRLLETCCAPLLLVPEKTTIQVPEKIVLALDFEKSINEFPIHYFDDIVKTLPSQLLIANVDPTEKFLPKSREELNNIHHTFDKYNPDYHYLNESDIAESINDFAIKQNAGWIISVPSRPGGILGIFRKSVTKQLAWHSSLPLLVLPKK